MMSMPYQCIRRCRNLLVAARGSSIDIFNPGDGSLRSTWKCPSVQEGNDSKPNTTSQVSEKPLNGLETQRSESSIDVALESPPPAKRRKLSAAGEEGPHQNAPSKEHEMKKDQKGNKKGNKRLEAVVSGLETPAVIALAATEDGRHVIAVTGEDKSIRVFENSVDGSGRQCLKQVSQRSVIPPIKSIVLLNNYSIMPKRPCTIAITPDDSTIISADKFGDVYSLPLLIPKTADLEPLQAATPNPEPTCAKPFVPAANNLTVHSQRNRKALENQKKQTPKPSEKPEPNFKYKLLLGHVSMLTGLALVVTPDGRNCILTADRDEHIRVSRGIPQAHIIEGFCLGHTGFISQLCIPRDRADILISGGGDDELFVWDWVRGMLVSKADLRSHVVGVMNELGGPAVEDRSTEGIKVAMSGITYLRQTGSEGVEDLVVVACEG